jgi:tetratricopeptide (TPR) repeat protein
MSSRTASDRARVLAVIVTTSASLVAAPARAQTGEAKAMAEALFREGKRLLDKGKIPEACEKLASSYKIDEALGTLLNLASCHEKQGRWATAWGEFNEALMIAKKAGQAPRQKFCKERIAAIEPKLSRLAVQVEQAAAVEGLEVTIDRVALARGAWGTLIPVDPGDHLIEASAPGREKWQTTVKLGETASQTVPVPVLKVLPPPEPAAPPPPPPRSKWKLPAGIAGVAAGAIGIGVGTYFGVRAFNYASTSNDLCNPDGTCTKLGLAAFQDGKSAANLSNVFFAVGGVLAAAGTVFIVLAAIEPGAQPQPKPATGLRLELAPAFGPSSGSLSLRGVF